jgi:selenoprotein W-related protein
MAFVAPVPLPMRAIASVPVTCTPEFPCGPINPVRPCRTPRACSTASLSPMSSISITPSQGGGVVGARVCIEYCVGCRWGLRASWTAQELLATFERGGALGEVALRPSDVSGIFRVWVVPALEIDRGGTVIWDRKLDGGFPEMKVLKQRVRDIVEPQKDLGHSDCKL